MNRHTFHIPRVAIFIGWLEIISVFAQATIFVNEIHYANVDLWDRLQFVEVAYLEGMDISGYQLVLYSGAIGRVYHRRSLSRVRAGDTIGGITFATSLLTGLGNGHSGGGSGIALVDESENVVQLISWEGSFLARNGPAEGMTSVDIGVRETGFRLPQRSLQLTGAGCVYDDFSWAGPLTQTIGGANSGQTILCVQSTELSTLAPSLSIQLSESPSSELGASSKPPAAPLGSPLPRSNQPTISEIPCHKPSFSSKPSSAPTPRVPKNRSSWMSGKHGVGFRVPGGVNFAAVRYDVSTLVNQIRGYPVSWIIVGLSSGAYGDRYLAPHSILTNLNRGSTPKLIDSATYNPSVNRTDLERLPDRDIFDEILTAMTAIDVRVIAYMSAQGPAMLKHSETRAYDYDNGSVYVNSTHDCFEFTADYTTPCAPSVRRWKEYVKNLPQYGSDDDATMQQAYADLVVGEFAEKYGSRLAGFWFDQGGVANGPALRSVIDQHNPTAVIAINSGLKNPLRNNNPGVEDYTFGHVTPLKGRTRHPDGCYNYGMMLSAESSNDGYVYEAISPNTINYGIISDLAARPTHWTYSGISASIAHMFVPLNTAWNNGQRVWNLKQAREWQTRVINSKGAWTWNVARCGCAGCSCDNPLEQAEINKADWDFLKQVFDGLPGGATPVSEPYYYNSTNCDCCNTRMSPTDAYAWGCGTIECS